MYPVSVDQSGIKEKNQWIRKASSHPAGITYRQLLTRVHLNIFQYSDRIGLNSIGTILCETFSNLFIYYKELEHV